MARSRRRNEEADAPLSPEGEAIRQAAQRAYFLSLFALIPGPSLVLGPIAAATGLIVYRRAAREPGFPGRASALVALVLGSAITLTAWAGLTLMVIGLRGD